MRRLIWTGREGSEALRRGLGSQEALALFIRLALAEGRRGRGSPRSDVAVPPAVTVLAPQEEAIFHVGAEKKL